MTSSSETRERPQKCIRSHLVFADGRQAVRMVTSCWITKNRSLIGGFDNITLIVRPKIGIIHKLTFIFFNWQNKPPKKDQPLLDVWVSGPQMGRKLARTAATGPDVRARGLDSARCQVPSRGGQHWPLGAAGDPWAKYRPVFICEGPGAPGKNRQKLSFRLSRLGWLEVNEPLDATCWPCFIHCHCTTEHVRAYQWRRPIHFWISAVSVLSLGWTSLQFFYTSDNSWMVQVRLMKPLGLPCGPALRLLCDRSRGWVNWHYWVQLERVTAKVDDECLDNVLGVARSVGL